MCLLLLNLKKYVIKSISITHPLNSECKITNNPLSIIHKNLTGSTITGRFLKLVFLALNSINNNKAILKLGRQSKYKGFPTVP